MQNVEVVKALRKIHQYCFFQQETLRVDWNWIRKNPSDFFDLSNSLYYLCKLGVLEKCRFDEEIDIYFNSHTQFTITLGFAYHMTPKGMGLFIQNF